MLTKHKVSVVMAAYNSELFIEEQLNSIINQSIKPHEIVIGNDVKITNTKTNDNRSYHVSSQKIKDILGFQTKYTIKDAVKDLKLAFEKKLLLDTFNNEFYFNIKRMNNIKLK